MYSAVALDDTKIESSADEKSPRDLNDTTILVTGGTNTNDNTSTPPALAIARDRITVHQKAIPPIVVPQLSAEEKKEKAQQARDKLIKKYLNLFYDILTILISIADVTTDILVLIAFYTAHHMTFFWISIAILIMAQIGYLIVFFACFETEDFRDNVLNICEKYCCWICIKCKLCSLLGKCVDKCIDKCWNKCCDNRCCNSRLCNKTTEAILILLAVIIVGCAGLLLFCCLLPFGHLVSFLMYFTEKKNARFTKFLDKKIGIQKRSSIRVEDKWSEMAQFTVDKINKHGGFILEAFLEALPQSILQLIYMVYYQQTNSIAVFSIVLSMTSIMTKSLVISQGIEWKSYFFTWLCVCTDFFSIFFIVSWIFLSNDHLNGDFAGYFSIIGEIWFIKIVIAILPPFAFAAVAYFTVGMWFVLFKIWKENRNEKRWVQIMFVILYFIFGNSLLIICYAVGVVVGCLILEIFCFTIIAAFIFVFFTVIRWDYNQKKTANVINKLLYFISNGGYTKNDKIIRILSINYAYNPKNTLGKYILERKEKETLYTVKYCDIRNNCDESEIANIFKYGYKLYFQLIFEYKKEFLDGVNWDFDDIAGALFYGSALLYFYISLPIYLLSRIVTIIYPYFIVFYLAYFNLWNKMDLFELTMLGIYILLQMTLLILGIFVARVHLWLWHVIPGTDSMSWSNDINTFLNKMHHFYNLVRWWPKTKEILQQKFGPDVAMIIIKYAYE